MTQTVTINSETGKAYVFSAYQQDASWNDVGGVYMMASPASNGGWHAYYIGIADSFKSRIPCHERWAEAARSGATHVLACVVSSAVEREALEKELCRTIQPSLNTHHV